MILVDIVVMTIYDSSGYCNDDDMMICDDI